MKIKSYAPILLFVYNRLEHTINTIEALKKNHLASESTLIIISDGAKNNSSQSEVDEVRDYIKTVTGFKSLEIVLQEKNLGLSENIITGVTKYINIYGKVIVLEDDLLSSEYFLLYMNEALNLYEQNDNIWHISGWNYPICSDGLSDTFLWKLMNCWGWATWKNRWINFDKNPDKLINDFSKEDIYKFNLDGSYNFWSQVEANKSGNKDTWAIFWYATIFINGGWCLNPSDSLINNIGLDASGTHRSLSKHYTTSLLDRKVNLEESTERNNNLAYSRIKNFFLKNYSFKARLFRKVKYLYHMYCN
ncbi:hypothetical protein AB4404_12030 [Vibrio breoganii]